MIRQQIAISVPKDLKEEFYSAAKQLGTNPSNLITMFMSNVVHTKEVHFRAFDKSFNYESFSYEEIRELQKEGKESYDMISELID